MTTPPTGLPSTPHASRRRHQSSNLSRSPSVQSRPPTVAAAPAHDEIIQGRVARRLRGRSRRSTAPSPMAPPSLPRMETPLHARTAASHVVNPSPRFAEMASPLVQPAQQSMQPPRPSSVQTPPRFVEMPPRFVHTPSPQIVGTPSAPRRVREDTPAVTPSPATRLAAAFLWSDIVRGANARSVGGGSQSSRPGTPGTQMPSSQRSGTQTPTLFDLGSPLADSLGVEVTLITYSSGVTVLQPLSGASTPNPRRVDVENVMISERTQRTRDSILALRDEISSPPSGDETVQKLITILEGTRAAPSTAPDALKRRRLGVREYDNALRTLRGMADNDRTPPIVDNPPFDLSFMDEAQDYPDDAIGLADLLGLIWGAIEQYKGEDDAATQRVQDTMHGGLLVALAECYDTDRENARYVPPSDAFRVCKIGVVQRLMSILQEHYPCVRIDADETGEILTNPGELLSTFAREFARDLDGEDPSQSELDDFVQAAKDRARELWEPGSLPLSVFDRQLEKYVTDDYSWENTNAVTPEDLDDDGDWI